MKKSGYLPYYFFYIKQPILAKSILISWFRKEKVMYSKKIAALGLVLVGLAVALSIPKCADTLHLLSISTFAIFTLLALGLYFSKD
ncbi:hypothetical protein [Streptococcus oricebi]|uniref:Uncharacterized protein n=1 Tax=Streptococcus oricebi TaxID=1547447 RepID=A0ABS5B5E0_9STRE|nr:hypothetical protein [Streptococcus oricebi]MBP2623194.1 hypothetical protein [Streptococcus oricebi]